MRGIVPISAVALAFLLASCAATPPPQDIWHPISGGAARGNLETDKVICRGEAEKAKLSAVRQRCGAIACMVQDAEIRKSVDTVLTACMAQRGWARG